MLNHLANGKIQGLFKAFECFSSIFKASFISRTFQDSLVYSSTFQACANPVDFTMSHSTLAHHLNKLCKAHIPNVTYNVPCLKVIGPLVEAKNFEKRLRCTGPQSFVRGGPNLISFFSSPEPKAHG